MNTEVNEVSINGVVYVKKGTESKPEIAENYFIVRAQSAGVFAGEIVARNGSEVEMKNARRIWYWSGAASLSQLAMDGTKKPNECKFPCEVASITLLGVLEIIPCTEVAQKSIKGVKIWQV